ncbi:hypothetical protein HCN44_010560 [Aphidius gifuensis]|uniref:Late endosomal/lysosomal adaptor and MAPK and MTOR activator 5 n=1 Tax=Aphidius gifuensis TaxID=684658 RepID=A0A835CQG6_APHGI|nr:uncharacterized protein LOC122855669 [Aphidius gifuensis]KAF7991759.1 hypothetical protein HCN44_010560 [Aphidius gifuensis]
MERQIDKTLEDVKNMPGVTGCLIADRSGLCLGSKGNVSSECAGMIAAIINQASKLEPGLDSPVVLFENETRQCIIQRDGLVTGAVFKDTSQ